LKEKEFEAEITEGTEDAEGNLIFRGLMTKNSIKP
jgi:hypothetical protein